jgi:hypothetical protein
MDYQITGIGLESERQRIDLLTAMIRKRKHISEITVKKLDDLILYCDNKVLCIGDEIKLKSDPDAQRSASVWQKTIVDLEKEKVLEQKDLFRDTLFLRNEWIKSVLNYREEKRLIEIIKQ